MTLHKPRILPFSHLFLIEPLAGSENTDSYFLNAVQQIVDTMIPEELWLELKNRNSFEAILYTLFSQLPLFWHSKLDEHSTSLTISYLCPAKQSQHARSFCLDTLSKWLNPGKQVEFSSSISMNFQFIQNPTLPFNATQETIAIRNAKENLAIRKNLPDLLIELKEKLPRESFRQPGVVHPIFMPRNEEELIRNLIVLAAQIKYVRDLPQVSIHYEKQTDTHLTFTVIIARLLKGKIEAMETALSNARLKIDIDDVRAMGCLKKYAKEGSILRVTLDKRPFFRADSSLDLLKARQKVAGEVDHLVGEFRDFNGGMISKQDEALHALRAEFGTLSQEREFLLENYFYSLKPSIMQTIHESTILQNHFELLIETLETKGKLDSHRIAASFAGKFFLCFVLFEGAGVKEEILRAIAPMQIPPRDLTVSFFEAGRATALGFILRTESTELADQFQTAILSVFY